MVKRLTALLLCVAPFLGAFEKLSESYLVKYGEEGALSQAIKYYSFACPYCVEVFKRDFLTVKEKYVDTGKMNYIFHPVPKDILTVSAMDCLEKLDEGQKRTFLRVMLSHIEPDNIALSIEVLKKAMELLGKPIPRLHEKDYLEQTRAFHSAFVFIAQDDCLSAVPAVEVDGKLYPKEVPDLDFFERVFANAE